MSAALEFPYTCGVNTKNGTVYIPLTPIGKPRITRMGKKAPRAMAYYAYAESLRLAATALRFTMPDSGFSVLFDMPMPDSWSKKKREKYRGQPHQQKPDLDNLLKATWDALCSEDCTIWQLCGAEKRWAETGSITIKQSLTRERVA